MFQKSNDNEGRSSNTDINNIECGCSTLLSSKFNLWYFNTLLILLFQYS